MKTNSHFQPGSIRAKTWDEIVADLAELEHTIPGKFDHQHSMVGLGLWKARDSHIAIANRLNLEHKLTLTFGK